MNYGIIYLHTNKVNGKVYVGQTIQDLERRCRKEDKSYNSYKNCPAMYAALLKYGWENFDTEVIAVAQSQADLNRLEEQCIREYKSADGTHGYNANYYSEGRGKQSDSTKAKLSQIALKKFAKMKEDGIVFIPSNKIEHKSINGISYKHCSGYAHPHWIPLTEFGVKKDTWDGLLNDCRACRALAQNEVRQKNPSKKLTPKEMKQSYIDRSEALKQGQKRRLEQNPNSNKGAKKNAKAILRIDPNTGDTKEYASGLICKADGFDNTYVSQACKTGKLFKGYRWIQKETGPKDPASKIK